MAALVRQSVDDLRVAFLAEHPVALEGLGVLAVRGDPAALREIVFNLLVNAAKYSAACAAITVTVGCAPPGAQVFVLDHGRGVGAGDAEHIFDEFVRADASSIGVGLGLFVARGLARAHGGDITVRPGEGGGSEFVLEFPRA